jgi:hypothetical protein
VLRSHFLAASGAAIVASQLPSEDALARYMAPHVAMAEFDGVVALAPGGNIVGLQSFGGSYSGTTRFAVASIAKTFTAVTVDTLLQTGALKLDTTIGSLFKPFAGSPITIDHLLNHTSGVPDIYSLSAFASGHRAPIAKDDYIALLAQVKPQFAPGTKSAYTNAGYSLLAFAVEEVTGMSFADVQRARVLGPLGLDNTDVLPGTNVLAGADPGLPNATRPAERIDPSWLIGNGSLYSCINDMSQWLHFVKAGTRVRTRTWSYPWGWGRDKAGTTLEGDGRYAGFACRAEVNLQSGDAVVVLSAIQSAVVNTIASDLMASLNGASLQPVAQRTFATLDAPAAQQYAGRYSLSPDFILTVGAFGDRIQVASADGVYEALDPLGADRFFFRVLNSALVFKRNAEGAVTAIDWGPGAFTLPRIVG